MKTSINPKVFLPLKKIQGTVSQRFERANNMNLELLNRIAEPAIEDKLKPATVRVAIERTLKKKIPLEIETDSNVKYEYSYLVDSNINLTGHCFNLPANYWTGKIAQGSVPQVLSNTQNLFFNLQNPKIFARYKTILNADMLKALKEKENKLLENCHKPILAEEMDKFLEGFSNVQKINLLQFMRYTLQQLQSKKEFEPVMNKTLKKYFYATTESKLNLETLKKNEKLVNDKLKSFINDERAALKTRN